MKAKTQTRKAARLVARNDSEDLVTRLAWLNLRYNDMLRSAVDWLWETDAELRLTYVSPTIAATVGVPAQTLLGRDLSGFFGLAEGAGTGDRTAAAIAARRSFRDDDVALDAGDPSGLTYRVTGVPYYEQETGRFAGYRGTGLVLRGPGSQAREDAAGTILEALEAALARKDQLEWELATAGDRALHARLASIAHELRTPLNAIVGFAEVIKEHHLGDDTGRYRDYARNIHESGLHMLEVITDLLDLATLEASETAASPRRLNVAGVVASALRMVEARANMAEVELVNDVDPAAPAVRGERHALRQILLNLLTNAIKFTPPGGAVGIECAAESARLLRLVVWDTGIGIAPEEQERVFQRAYRAPQKDLQPPGSGLGLSIARSLARSMGGDITLSSRPGDGSRVTVTLPLDPDQPKQPAEG